ncbi:MAG TPA: class I SAM-dependent methyltransferase [Nocardioides sp.]|nr:class I SAM-dependent methyltransferase [Nocardioides sp.]
MDLDTFRWLLTDAGQELLGQASEAPREELKAQAQLRQVAPGSDEERAARVAAAIGQVTLRRKAAAKFGDDAAAMYFTPDGLEQATRATVAAHRAARLAAASAGSVIDLGCGIGGDLLAFARAGITSAGIDVDPVRIEVARANLAALGLPGAVSVADATKVDTTPFDAAYVDPARRTGRGRTFTIDDWTPPWAFVEQLMRRDTCVKAAPGFPHARIPEDVEAEWVSDSGEVKEAVLWSGRLATTRRRATVIGQGGLATLTDEDDPGGSARDVGEFLYEPDGAVIRAGLVTAVAAGVKGGLVDDHIAYVTSDEAFRTPFARGFRVIETLPYREKALRAALRERNIGSLTIKKRGVGVVPEDLRKRLSLTGDEAATIVLTRARGHGIALLVESF